MTSELEHLEIVKQGPAAIHDWRTAHPDERLDLSKADLSNADLRYADLSGANLTGANLIGANVLGVATNCDTILPDGQRWANPLITFTEGEPASPVMG